MTTTPRGESIPADVHHRQDSISTFFWGLPLVRLIFGPPAIIILLIAIYGSYSMFAEYVQNPNRHWYEVAVMLPLVSFFGLIPASISRVFSYLVMLIYVAVLFRQVDRAPLHLLLLATPLLGFLTWYGYDCFVLDFRWYTDEGLPYVHGLTQERFLKAWGFEAAIALGYWWLLRKSRVNSVVLS